MKGENTLLFYFTATGNSLYVAKQLENDPISIPQELRKANRHYISDSIGIVCPLFEFEIPKLVKDFIQGSSFETDYFYLLITYGHWQESGLCEYDHYARQCADRV